MPPNVATPSAVNEHLKTHEDPAGKLTYWDVRNLERRSISIGIFLVPIQADTYIRRVAELRICQKQFQRYPTPHSICKPPANLCSLSSGDDIGGNIMYAMIRFVSTRGLSLN